MLFDREGVRGKSIVQLADYATMRGFARTRPAEGDAALDTILALFDPSHEPPRGADRLRPGLLAQRLQARSPTFPAAMKLLDVSDELEPGARARRPPRPARARVALRRRA